MQFVSFKNIASFLKWLDTIFFNNKESLSLHKHTHPLPISHMVVEGGVMGIMFNGKEGPWVVGELLHLWNFEAC